MGRYVFNLYPGAPTLGATLGQFARRFRNMDTAYRLIDPSISDDVSTCDGFEYSFESLGGEVVGTASFNRRINQSRRRLRACGACRAWDAPQAGDLRRD